MGTPHPRPVRAIQADSLIPQIIADQVADQLDPPLFRLPLEVFEQVAAALPIFDLLRLRRANRRLAETMNNIGRVRELVWIPPLSAIHPLPFQPRVADNIKLKLTFVKYVGPLTPMPDYLKVKVHPFLAAGLLYCVSYDIEQHERSDDFFQYGVELTISAPHLLRIVNEGQSRQSEWREMVVTSPNVHLLFLHLQMFAYASQPSSAMNFHGGDENVGVTLGEVVKRICDAEPNWRDSLVKQPFIDNRHAW